MTPHLRFGLLVLFDFDLCALGEKNCMIIRISLFLLERTELNMFPLPSIYWLSIFSFSFQQADLKNQLGDAGYVVFGVVLFVWELLPTTLVVYFFRVRNPTKDLVSKPLCLQKISPHSHHRACSWNIFWDFQLRASSILFWYEKFWSSRCGPAVNEPD